MQSTDSSARQIAITGMAFRFPGGSSTTSAFWTFLNSGQSAIRETPADRFDIASFYSSDPDDPGTTYSRCAGYVENPYSFDAKFFRISSAEALEMDPQQRWLLELTWAALENAGLVPSELRGQRVGLFLTTGEVDYGRRTVWSGDPRRITTYARLGTSRAVAAGRVAHFLGLQGPAVFVDTACSSSLVAVHLAAQSLRAGDCDLAIAGGVNLILGPEETIGVARLHAMSLSETCRPFDAGADGYMRGEGGGVVVLRRLDEAISQGDRIDAVLAGSSINNDGASSGLTAPNGAAQEAVIKQALRHAAAAPDDIAYVEAHGTGTPLGDPIELSALRNAYTRLVERRAPLLVGSVKAQIGHLEGAAGIAGLIKAILVLRHGFVPFQVNFVEPNPRFRWEGSHLKVPREGHVLSGEKLLVGVSGFGISGTNAHLILARHASEKPTAPAARERVLTISAQSAKGRSALALEYRRLIDGGRIALRDICYTASAKRDHWGFRVAVVGASEKDFVGAMDAYLAAEDSGRWHSGERGRSRKLVFLFPGQGAWQPGVGAGLYAENPIFKGFVDTCLRKLAADVAASVLQAIQGHHASSVRHHPGQLAHFIVLYSLANTWMDLGVKPDVLIGHSLGEHVAAVIGGAMSVDDGLKAVEARGRLFDTKTPRGAMLAVAAGADELSGLLSFGGNLFVAGMNGPEQTVLSGTVEAIASVEALMSGLGKRVSNLKTYGTPGHSPLLASMREPFRETLTSLKLGLPSIPIVSTVTGRLATERMSEVDYWLDLVEQPVRFAQALETVLDDDVTFLEVGPGAALSNLARAATLDWQRAVSSLADGPEGDEDPESTGFAHACARLYTAGFSLNWSRLYGIPPRPAEIPGYPFEADTFEIPVPPRARTEDSEKAAMLRQAIVGIDALAHRGGGSTMSEALNAKSRSGDHFISVLRAIARSVAAIAGDLSDDLPLVQQGFDSLALTELRVRLQQTFGRMPPISMFAKGASLKDLAGFVGRSANSVAPVQPILVKGQSHASTTHSKDTEQRSLVVSLRKGSGPLVALVHPVGGDVFCYQEMADAWPGDSTVVGLRHPYADHDSQASFLSMDQLAEVYRHALWKVLGRIPDLVGGWSFGGLIAHAMAAQWEDTGITAPPLAIIDSPFGDGPAARRLDVIVGDMGLPRGEALVEFLQADKRFQSMLDSDFHLAEARHRLGHDAFARLARLHACNAAAFALHASRRVRAPIAYALALRGQNGLSAQEVAEPLRLMTEGAIRICVFDDDHNSIVRMPAAGRLAQFMGGSTSADDAVTMPNTEVMP